MARASSIMATWPLAGSAAPIAQPSRWLPRMIHSSGYSEPSMRAITLYAGSRFQSNSRWTRTVAGPGPKW